MLVVDASIAVKWFLEEGDSQEAIALLDSGLKLVSPPLVKYEVAGAFYRRVRDGEISAVDAASYCERWLHGIKTHVVRLDDDHRDIRQGGEIAAKLGHVLADCIYLAMAERLQVPLVTADAAFVRRARKKRHKNLVNLPQALGLAA